VAGIAGSFNRRNDACFGESLILFSATKPEIASHRIIMMNDRRVNTDAIARLVEPALQLFARA
jgi:hypothetical protein